MPELPEVEILRRYFEEVALTSEVVDLEFYDDLNKVLATTREILCEELIGQRFTGTRRIGKYLFAHLSSGAWLHLHFGMTGDLQLFREADVLPPYTRFVIVFKNGDRLAFRDLRKFGVVDIVSDPEEYQREKAIGTDLLEISENAFVAALSGRQTPVKNALLQQNKIAGIGNWIADEMLFNTGIHPETSPDKLSRKELVSLFVEGQKIAKRAIEDDTHYGDFPRDLFVNYRKKGAIHPQFPDSPVQQIKLGGRGTYYIPAKQRKK